MKAKSERRRRFVGYQLEDCRDSSGLFYILPFQEVRY
jgi:actin-related protein 6